MDFWALDEAAPIAKDNFKPLPVRVSCVLERRARELKRHVLAPAVLLLQMDEGRKKVAALTLAETQAKHAAAQATAEAQRTVAAAAAKMFQQQQEQQQEQQQ